MENTKEVVKEKVAETVDEVNVVEDSTVVEKIIIQEVPVVEVRERIIEREVPVEKVVEKIVEVEVEKIVEVPVEIIKEVAPKLDFKSAIEVAKSLALFNTELENIVKNAKNPFFKSSYLDLSAISNTVRPLLAKYGLSVIQHPIDNEEGKISVTTILLHSSGQYLEFPGIWAKPSKMGDIQQASATITYLKRISIAAILFVSGCDEDDDGEKAVGRGEETPKTTVSTPSARGSLRGSRL